MFSPFDDIYIVSDIVGAGLYALDLISGAVLFKKVTDIPPTPHNIAGSGDLIFVTHSGPTNDIVTVWDISSGEFVLVNEVVVGLNPFGLDYVPTTCTLGDIANNLVCPSVLQCIQHFSFTIQYSGPNSLWDDLQTTNSLL